MFRRFRGTGSESSRGSNSHGSNTPEPPGSGPEPEAGRKGEADLVVATERVADAVNNLENLIALDQAHTRARLNALEQRIFAIERVVTHALAGGQQPKQVPRAKHPSQQAPARAALTPGAQQTAATRPKPQRAAPNARRPATRPVVETGRQTAVTSDGAEASQSERRSDRGQKEKKPAEQREAERAAIRAAAKKSAAQTKAGNPSASGGAAPASPAGKRPGSRAPKVSRGSSESRPQDRE